MSTDGRFSGVVVAGLEPACFKTLMESVCYVPDSRESMGRLQEQGMNLDVLLNLTDQVLYHAKQAGRNQVSASE